MASLIRNLISLGPDEEESTRTHPIESLNDILQAAETERLMSLYVGDNLRQVVMHLVSESVHSYGGDNWQPASALLDSASMLECLALPVDNGTQQFWEEAVRLVIDRGFKEHPSEFSCSYFLSDLAMMVTTNSLNWLRAKIVDHIVRALDRSAAIVVSYSFEQCTATYRITIGWNCQTNLVYSGV